MRKFLDPEFLSKLFVTLFYRVKNNTLHFSISTLLLEFFNLRFLDLLGPLRSLIEFAFVDTVTGPFIPAPGDLRCFNLLSKLILNVLVLFFLKFINGFLFILCYKEVFQSLIFLWERYHFFLFCLKAFKILIDIKCDFQLLFLLGSLLFKNWLDFSSRFICLDCNRGIICELLSSFLYFFNRLLFDFRYRQCFLFKCPGSLEECTTFRVILMIFFDLVHEHSSLFLQYLLFVLLCFLHELQTHDTFGFLLVFVRLLSSFFLWVECNFDIVITIITALWIFITVAAS